MLSRISSLVTACAAAGILLSSAGCSSSKKAANADPAPQSLSEPVRIVEAAPVVEEQRAIPVSVRENDPAPLPVAIRTGESVPLPAFQEPARAEPAGPKSSGTFQDPNKSGNYHTLAKGETLSAVSRKYNVKLKKLIDANHFQDPNKLPVGTKVYVPN